MTLDDLRTIVAGIAPEVHAHVTRSVEARVAQALASADVPGLIARAIGEAVAALPVPKDGEPGRDGASVTLDDVLPAIERGLPDLVSRSVAQAVAAIPPAKDGIDGKDGAPGADGTPGEKGADGLPGKDGRDGEPGPQGEPGPPGEKGADGRDGEPGAKGDTGPVGEKGMDGRPGRDGVDGRDAALIEPIEAIDAAKSYPRGTWAKHAGGLVRSVRATDPIGEGADIGRAGWQVAVEGIASFAIDHDGERGFVMRAMTTSGAVQTKAATIPAVIYRGVWKEGGHDTGDGVTWGGSMWIAKRATDAKPGESDDWQLAVKRGRDGADRVERKP